MVPNEEEVSRAKQSAEKLMEDGDFVGAKLLLMEARGLCSGFQNELPQMLAVCDVHSSASNGLEDWYDILQVGRSCDDDTIRKQYKKLALLLHPDKNKFAGADAAFKLIGQATKLLTNKEQRIEYDKKLNANSAPCFTYCEQCGLECEVLREYADKQVICPSCLTKYAEPRLVYIDPIGIIQGPFPLSKFIIWLKEGYFGTELKVRFADAPQGAPFRDLGSVMSDLKTESVHAHAHTSDQNESMSTSKSKIQKPIDLDDSDISETKNKKMDCNKEEASRPLENLMQDGNFVPVQALPCDQSAESSKTEKTERKMMKNIDDEILETESGPRMKMGHNLRKRQTISYTVGHVGMKKVNKHVPKMVFSTEQGLLLLTEVKKFYSEKQERNFSKLVHEFYLYVKPKLTPCKADHKQIRNKIENLRKKYKNVTQVVIEGEDGENEVASREEFKLWQDIWGNPGVLDYKAKA